MPIPPYGLIAGGIRWQSGESHQNFIGERFSSKIYTKYFSVVQHLILLTIIFFV